LLTDREYASTTFTLQTKPTSWSSSSSVSTTFVFGLVGDIDPFTPAVDLHPIYRLIWNFTASTLSLTFEDGAGTVTTLASKVFSQVQTSTNTISIQQDLRTIRVYVDNLTTPALTATSLYLTPVGRFGWIQRATATVPYETFVNYVNFNGRTCTPFNV